MTSKKNTASFYKFKTTFEAIGYVQSTYKQRFGIPHQAGVSQGLTAFVQLNPLADYKTALKGLETFSHIWLLFVFHEHGGHKWKPSIRPPRLGGNKKVGLFASRSPHRPNPIGMSAVKLHAIDLDHPEGPRLHISEVDLLDGTPILDIKPYIPLADCMSEANAGWADIPIKRYTVQVSELAQQEMTEISLQLGEDFQARAISMLELDPRPAFQKRKIPVEKIENNGKKFGLSVLNYDVKYEILNDGFLITRVLLINK